MPITTILFFSQSSHESLSSLLPAHLHLFFPLQPSASPTPALNLPLGEQLVSGVLCWAFITGSPFIAVALTYVLLDYLSVHLLAFFLLVPGCTAPHG